MNNTDLNLNQPVPQLFEDKPIKIRTTSIAFDVVEDLKKYSRIFISKQYDPSPTDPPVRCARRP